MQMAAVRSQEFHFKVLLWSLGENCIVKIRSSSDIIDPISLSKVVSFSEASGSLMEAPRRLSTNKLESVHSSSDQKIYPKVTRDFAPKEESIDVSFFA